MGHEEPAPSQSTPSEQTTDPAGSVLSPISEHAGSLRELLGLAWPLVLSSSFWTIQLFLDGVFLTWYDPKAVAAIMGAAVLFWTPFILLQTTANYATTFVAQYLGAGRKERVGPAVWQGLYFGIGTGILFMGLWFLARPFFNMVGHQPDVREMEITYFQCLCFCALPLLITASCNAFFAGRGESRIVLLVDATGTAINATLGYLMIFGELGFPRMGIAGAGWAMVIGSSAAALLAFTLMLRRKYRDEYSTWAGRRFDRDLFKRLLRFGVPAGLQWSLDGLAFNVFISVVGYFGVEALAATSIAHRVNITAFLPMLGIGQAVAVLVGQRLGQNRPDLAEKSAKMGLKVSAVFMGFAALTFVVVPSFYTSMFAPSAGSEGAASWPQVEPIVFNILIFVAIYSLFNSIEVVYTFALRGAGDTVFVTWVSIAMAWPIMVLPTVLFAWLADLGLYWAWGFATAYIIALSIVFMLRFRHGKWKSMRVIEHAPPVAH